MSRATIAVSATAALAAALLCDGTSGAEPVAVEWGPLTRGLRMSIRLEGGPQYRADEPAVLEVLIENTTDAEVSLGMSADDWSSFDFAVEYVGGGMTRGGRLPLTRYGERRLQSYGAAKNVPVRVKPGSPRRYRLPINRMVDMSESGIYSITAGRFVPARSRHDDTGKRIPAGSGQADELVSNVLTVTAKEPPPLAQ